jgi:hypothetical protein
MKFRMIVHLLANYYGLICVAVVRQQSPEVKFCKLQLYCTYTTSVCVLLLRYG